MNFNKCIRMSREPYIVKALGRQENWWKAISDHPSAYMTELSARTLQPAWVQCTAM